MNYIQQVKKEFLSSTEFIHILPGQEGQFIANDDGTDYRGRSIGCKPGSIVIGDRAGPSLDCSNIIHELSHLVEIDDERMFSHGWGLRLPEVWVYDRMCLEPTTTKATEREIRVFGYQINVLKYLGYKPDIKLMVGSMRFMADYILFKGPDKNRNKTILEMVMQQAEINTLDKFVNELNRKISLINSKFGN